MTGSIYANGGGGGGETGIGYDGGGGSGGGLFFHAPTIALAPSAIVEADGGGLSGGGGQILFLTSSGTINDQTSNLSVSPTLYGQIGVISYGVLPHAVPEPSSILLAVIGGSVVLVYGRRRFVS